MGNEGETRRIQINAKSPRMKWYCEPGPGLWARNPIVKEAGTCGFGLWMHRWNIQVLRRQSENRMETELEDRSWSLDLTGTWVAVEAVDVKGWRSSGFLDWTCQESSMGPRNSLLYLLLRPKTRTMGGCLSPRKSRDPGCSARAQGWIQEGSPRVGNELKEQSIWGSSSFHLLFGGFTTLSLFVLKNHSYWLVCVWGKESRSVY